MSRQGILIRPCQGRPVKSIKYSAALLAVFSRENGELCYAAAFALYRSVYFTLAPIGEYVLLSSTNWTLAVIRHIRLRPFFHHNQDTSRHPLKTWELELEALSKSPKDTSEVL